MKQYSWNRHDIKSTLFERFDNDIPCLRFISTINLCLVQEACTRYSAIECICMCRSHYGHIQTRLRPDRCPCGMGMHNAANLRIMLVQNRMSRCIRRRSHIAFNHIAIQINNHHIARLHRFIIDTAWLDHK